MPSVMPITDFRKKIFDVADWIVSSGGSVDVQRNDRTIFRVIPVSEETPAQKAEYLLKYVLPGLGGIWKDVPQSEFDEVNRKLRGKRVMKYMKKIRKPWIK